MEAEFRDFVEQTIRQQCNGLEAPQERNDEKYVAIRNAIRSARTALKNYINREPRDKKLRERMIYTVQAAVTEAEYRLALSTLEPAHLP